MKIEQEAVRVQPQAAMQAHIGGSYSERMRALREWVYTRCCKGRTMKTPVVRGRDLDVAWREPKCFGGDFYPARALDRRNPYSIAPSILVARISHTPYAETMEYLDSRIKVSRPKELGNTLTINLIHTVYEPGERTESGGGDPHEALATDESIDTGSLILGQWMEDTAAELAAALSVAGMAVKRSSIVIEPLIENEAVSDRRPLYLGVVQATLVGVDRELPNPEISALLD